MNELQTIHEENFVFPIEVNEIAKKEKKRKEEERVEKIVNRIAEIKTWPSPAITMSSKEILFMLNDLESEEYTDPGWAEEYEEKAIVVVTEVKEHLLNLHEMKLQAEKATETQAKLEKEREEKEEQERIHEEEEQKKIAAENAKKEAELKIVADKLVADRKALEVEKTAAEEKRKAEERRTVEARKEEERKAKEAREAEKAREAEEAEKAVLAAKNLKANIAQTVHDLSYFFHCFEEGNGLRFINSIRAGEFAHIKWVD